MISAIVLAAGKSTRMGRSKAALPLGGAETFLSRIVRAFREAGVEDVVVVIGHDRERVVQSFAASGLPATMVVNPGYESGQLSSLVAGVQAIQRPDVEAALITLVDVPLVTAATIRAVVDRYRQRRAPVVRPVRGNAHGHPVLVDRILFDAILAADPAIGAKGVVRAHASPAGDVETTDDGAFLDIDTPAEYERVLKGFGTP